MNEARYASLSSGLLARKGAAKPAMRPQSFSSFEDLGWNDMGYASPAPEPEEVREHVPSSIAALTPAPRIGRPDEAGDESAPIVVAQQQALAERLEIEEEPAVEPAPKPVSKAKVVALPKRVRTVPAGKKAAFTLRLDAERHLRLRLACAVAGRSAQQLVTQALDDLLATFPELDDLAQRVPSSGTQRN